MSTKNTRQEITDEMLHAYVDGGLSDTERKSVEAYLANTPAKAEEVADWQRQNAAIGALFPRKEAERRTEGILLTAADERHGSRWNRPLRAAAAIALIVFGVGAGWFGRGALDGNSTVAADLVAEALTAHSIYTAEVLHPVEVTAADESHLVGWLSKRLGARIVAPDLSMSGYELVGGRLLPAADGPAAQFMYENDDGRRITLYARRGAPGQLAAFQFRRRGRLASFYWQDESLNYALVGEASRAELNALAVEVYRQLS